MPTRKSRLLIDSSVAVMWHIKAEPHEKQARELLLDWQNGVVEFCCSDQLRVEFASALLKAVRRGRTTREAAHESIREIFAIPFKVFRATERILTRAFAIAELNNQKIYDCVYVALAEKHRTEFWTGDERLYNALHAQCPFVRWIAHYQRKRS